MDSERIESLLFELLEALEVSLDRSDRQATARRVASLWVDLLAGQGQDASKLLHGGIPCGHDEMVALVDIPFYSVCEHHLLPFFGSVSLVYIPGVNGRIAGASNLTRVVDAVSRRLQLQERLTVDVANAIKSGLGSDGVCVIARAQHLCMTMKDRTNVGSQLVTIAANGLLETNDALRAQAFFLLGTRGDAVSGQTKKGDEENF